MLRLPCAPPRRGLRLGTVRTTPADAVPLRPSPVLPRLPVPLRPSPVLPRLPVPLRPPPVLPRLPVPLRPLPALPRLPVPLRPSPVLPRLPVPLRPSPVLPRLPVASRQSPVSLRSATVQRLPHRMPPQALPRGPRQGPRHVPLSAPAQDNPTVSAHVRPVRQRRVAGQGDFIAQECKSVGSGRKIETAGEPTAAEPAAAAAAQLGGAGPDATRRAPGVRGEAGPPSAGTEGDLTRLPGARTARRGGVRGLGRRREGRHHPPAGLAA